MKNLKHSLWILAASALTLSSCVEEQSLAPQVENPEMVSIKITAGAPATKTLLDGTMQVKWHTDGESIQVIENTPDGFTTKTAYSEKIAQDGSTATFNLNLRYNGAKQEFNYWAICPSSNFIEQGNKNLTAFKLKIPAAQKPKATTFNQDADLIISRKVTTQSQPWEALDFQFTRPVAIAEMTLKGIEDGEKISEIVFSNSTAPLAGEMTYDLMADKVVGYGTDNVKEIKMTFYNGKVASKAGTKIYFTAFPADFKDFTVIVKTDQATYSKTVDCTKSATPLFFKANHYAQFSVNNLTRVGLPEITFPEWDENAEQSGQGGKITIPYTLKNPVEGATIKLSTYNADNFIKNLKAENGNITFDLMPNEFETSRKYTIFVDYVKNGTELLNAQVKVKQAAKSVTTIPVLTLDWDNTTVLSADGGTFTVPYTLENPIEGASLVFSTFNESTFTNTDCITNIKAENGQISFTLAPANVLEIQKYVIYVDYKKDGKELIQKQIKFKQEAMKVTAELTFSLELSTIKSDGIYIYLTPSDLNATYVVETVEKAIFDNMTPEAYIQSRLDEWKGFHEPISNHLKSGELSWYKVPFKNMNTAYYVVVYGLNEDGTITTKNVTKAEFLSPAPPATISLVNWDNTAEFPKASAHQIVKVQVTNATDNVDLTAESNVIWIKNVTVEKVSTGEYNVSFDVEENTNFSGRSGKVVCKYGSTEKNINYYQK